MLATQPTFTVETEDERLSERSLDLLAALCLSAADADLEEEEHAACLATANRTEHRA